MAATARPAKKRAKRASAPRTTIQALATAKPVPKEKTSAAKGAKGKDSKATRVKAPGSRPAATTPAPTQPASPKRVRGEFTMPEADYERIVALKATARRVGLKVKKNELLRLGLQALQGLHEDELRSAVLALRAPPPNIAR